MRLMLALIAALMLALIAALLLTPSLVWAQQEYTLVKSDRSESFVLPFTASNRNEDNPLVYTFDEPKAPSWILTIENSLEYVPSNDSRTVIKIMEPAPSEKYVELVIYGGESKRFWAAVNTPEAGYARIYDQPNGWTADGPMSVSHSDNGGITVGNGQRTVVDRIDLNGFAVGSIAVYGNDDEKTTANAYAGDITFELLFGSFEQSSLYYVPLGVTLGVGGVIVGLLLLKKRKAD